ncbi:hypothetical protein ANO11243_066060 [Dothideomycetidae sp. 11243]|nr:hypothetical protein ANO11243_066060 [fungal sp. No.11243]
MAPNLAIVSLPAYFFLTLAPHVYALSIASGPTGLVKYDNRCPRAAGYLENLRKQLTPSQFTRWERAEAAHRNGIENFPLFASAVFACLLADGAAAKVGLGLTAGISEETRKFIYGWFASRLVYTLIYIGTEDNRKTFLRTIVYFTGVTFCFQQFWRAANVLGN